MMLSVLNILWGECGVHGGGSRGGATAAAAATQEQVGRISTHLAHTFHRCNAKFGLECCASTATEYHLITYVHARPALCGANARLLLAVVFACSDCRRPFELIRSRQALSHVRLGYHSPTTLVAPQGRQRRQGTQGRRAIYYESTRATDVVRRRPIANFG